jgi:hypothetical protein
MIIVFRKLNTLYNWYMQRTGFGIEIKGKTRGTGEGQIMTHHGHMLHEAVDIVALFQNGLPEDHFHQ